MEEIWLKPYVSQDFDSKAAAEARKAEMAGMNEQIDQRLKEIFSVERFKEYLELSSRLRRYSVNNQLLIMSQKPDAVMCQSFEKWKDAGRFNNGGYMIIEIEYYKYHTKLIGGDVSSSDLNRLLMQAEKLYDKESDNFERVLCSLIQYDIIETDERPDYVYDRDIKKLYKPRYN